MVAMEAMEVAIMLVINVVSMLNSSMAAIFTVSMRMPFMLATRFAFSVLAGVGMFHVLSSFSLLRAGA
jgi:hypothetical protein